MEKFARRGYSKNLIQKIGKEIGQTSRQEIRQKNK